MKTIPLTQGQFAQVDDVDYPILNQFKWTADFSKKMNSFYAFRRVNVNGKRIKEYMARRIMGLTIGDKRTVDHLNHNTLCNIRSNLEIKSHAGNMRNKLKRASASSKYIGVSLDKNKNRRRSWRSEITPNGQQIFLGYFKSEIAAALAYNGAALKYGFLTRNEIPFQSIYLNTMDC